MGKPRKKVSVLADRDTGTVLDCEKWELLVTFQNLGRNTISKIPSLLCSLAGVCY